MREVESESVDAVISTIVLCSVRDANQCLQIIRVLKPGGNLFFLEHVKAPCRLYMIRFIQVLLDFFSCVAHDLRRKHQEVGIRLCERGRI